jgi:hypothetical protein
LWREAISILPLLPYERLTAYVLHELCAQRRSRTAMGFRTGRATTKMRS